MATMHGMNTETYERANELSRQIEGTKEYIAELTRDNESGGSVILAPLVFKRRAGYPNDVRDIINETTTFLVGRYQDLLAKLEAEFATL